MDNYVYVLDGKAYINLTNRCHNDCRFCIRNTGDGVAGTELWLKKEPTASEVLRAFSSLKNELKYDEVVFCGFGEPTEALDVMTEVARALKAEGYRTRLNTNGLGNLVNGCDITEKLYGVLDTVSVSLNDCDEKSYADVTRSAFGEEAFSAVLDFAKGCKARGIDTVFTVVDTIGNEHIEKCRDISLKTGIPLRVREYISDNYSDRK